MDAQQAELDDQARADQAKNKQQDFDDLLSGKKTQKTSEKNLQTLFKEFYEQASEKAKDTDPTQFVNSAKSSIGAFSAKLEARRNKIKQMKEDAMNIDKDKTVDKATEQPKKEEQKVDASKDKATDAAKEEETTTEEAKDESKDQAKEQEAKPDEEEEIKEPKLSFKDRAKAKMSSINDRYKEKFPNAHEKTSKYSTTLAEVWAETFPDTKAMM